MNKKKGMSREQIVLLRILDDLRKQLIETDMPKVRALLPMRFAALQEDDADRWIAYFHGRIDLIAQDIRSGKRLLLAAFNIGMMRGIIMADNDSDFRETETELQYKVTGA